MLRPRSLGRPARSGFSEICLVLQMSGSKGWLWQGRHQPSLNGARFEPCRLHGMRQQSRSYHLHCHQPHLPQFELPAGVLELQCASISCGPGPEEFPVHLHCDIDFIVSTN